MMKHFVYSISFFLFSAPIMGMEIDSKQKTAHLLLYGEDSTPVVGRNSPVPAVSVQPTTLWERLCVGQHYVYLGGFSLYAARHFLNKPAVVSKAFGGTLFLFGAALVGAAIYPFSFWQKPVEKFRKKVAEYASTQ